MGLFGLFKGKKRDVQEQAELSMQDELNEASKRQDYEKQRRLNQNNIKGSMKLNTHTERITYVRESCETILESNRQITDAKMEYQVVTSYLTDMQKIDMIPMEQRGNLQEAARKIINLSNERSKLQKKSNILSERQYRLFERYELQLPKELPLIREKEAFQAIIKQDMMHLEKEREVLDEQQEEIISRQAFLKGIVTTTSIIILLLFGVFGLLSFYTDASFTIPFLLTVLMGMISALYIFMEARKNASNIHLVQSKQNRQIMLMNKVKIKSVNNRNYLEYSYNKYMVENYEQLKVSWEEYIRLKDEARRYQSNTELLEFFNNELIQELKKCGVVDSEIWIYQPSAILDNKEMVEVRHRLNVRRQKLRERIDLNNKQKEDALEEIKRIISTYPDCKEESEKLLRRYQIETEA